MSTNCLHKAKLTRHARRHYEKILVYFDRHLHERTNVKFSCVLVDSTCLFMYWNYGCWILSHYFVYSSSTKHVCQNIVLVDDKQAYKLDAVF